MRYFTYRFGGRVQVIGKSGLSYHFVHKGITPVEIEADAEWFLRMGTPESGTYLFREVDSAGNPIGVFPPIDVEKRVSTIDPKRFPTDVGAPTASEWRELTEDMSDPWLFYHVSRQKLIP